MKLMASITFRSLATDSNPNGPTLAFKSLASDLQGRAFVGDSWVDVDALVDLSDDLETL
jgi:hypothetical protein